MMTMQVKYLTTIAIIVCSICGYGQATENYVVKIFNSFDDYENNIFTSLTDSTLTTNKNLWKDTSKLKGIWGLAHNDVTYRLFVDKLFKIEDNTRLIIYSLINQSEKWQDKSFMMPLFINDTMFFIPTGSYGYETSNDKNYYFSTSLNKEIHQLSKENLIREVNDKTFEKAINKKFRYSWWFPISEYHSRTNVFLVNEVYESVLKKQRK